jgi:hypothetical protein
MMVPMWLVYRHVATDHARVELFQLQSPLPNMGIQRRRMFHAADGDLQRFFHLF